MTIGYNIIVLASTCLMSSTFAAMFNNMFTDNCPDDQAIKQKLSCNQSWRERYFGSKNLEFKCIVQKDQCPSLNHNDGVLRLVQEDIKGRFSGKSTSKLCKYTLDCSNADKSNTEKSNTDSNKETKSNPKQEKQNPKEQWTINLLNNDFEATEKEEFLCKELIDYCIEENCYQVMKKVKANKLPTQRLYTNMKTKSKETLRIPIDNWQFNKDSTLICVDDTLFKERIPMVGIIEAGNSYDIVNIIPIQDQNQKHIWQVSEIKREDTQQIMGESQTIQPCKHLKQLINAQGNIISKSVFDASLSGKDILPFVTTEQANQKPDISHLSQCKDEGVLYDLNNKNLIKCDKIVCHDGGDLSTVSHSRAFVQCDATYHLKWVYKHQKEDDNRNERFCLSKFPSDDKIKSQTLKEMLIEQGSNRQEAISIMGKYYEQVRAYPFWGDVEEQVERNPHYKEFQKQDLVNFMEKKHITSTALEGELKEIFSNIRGCIDDDADEKKRCSNKICMLRIPHNISFLTLFIYSTYI